MDAVFVKFGGEQFDDQTNELLNAVVDKTKIVNLIILFT